MLPICSCVQGHSLDHGKYSSGHTLKEKRKRFPVSQKLPTAAISSPEIGGAWRSSTSTILKIWVSWFCTGVMQVTVDARLGVHKCHSHAVCRRQHFLAQPFPHPLALAISLPLLPQCSCTLEVWEGIGIDVLFRTEHSGSSPQHLVQLISTLSVAHGKMKILWPWLRATRTYIFKHKYLDYCLTVWQFIKITVIGSILWDEKKKKNIEIVFLQ